MKGMRRWFNVVPLAALLACGSQHPSGPIAGLPFATALPSCGPADGPAVEILLASSAAGSEPQAPYVRIWLTHGISAIAGKTFALGDINGSATYVSGPGASEGATAGLVRIGTADTARGVTGTLNLSFPSRGKVSGEFTATWTPRTMLCG